MIHIAPSRGPEHRVPKDCWRFYRDGMQAMAYWTGLKCIEATTDWDSIHRAYMKQRRPRAFAKLPLHDVPSDTI